MARAMSVLEHIGAAGVLPVVVLDDADDAPALGAALLRAGLPCAEITFRTAAAAAAIAKLADEPALVVGAGTVITVDQVDWAVAAGARFVVAPGFDAAVVRRCREHDVAVLPGVATATDVMAAIREGLTAVKLFPAGALGGVAMVDALAGPFPGLRFVPTGGIAVDDVPNYLARPSVLAVGGSWVAPRALLRARRFDDVTRLAADAVAAVAAARATEAAPA
jgi:2-dehydro-3-deoxyphosphogluconate aldolase/(4S)-4-hydroxy-2-oxoglutarate aldolase